MFASQDLSNGRRLEFCWQRYSSETFILHQIITEKALQVFIIDITVVDPEVCEGGGILEKVFAC